MMSAVACTLTLTSMATARRATVRDVRLLGVTDRLRDEYTDAPAIVVLRAVSEARRELRLAGVVLAPAELIGARARGLLQPWARRG
jgi:hypothetical protein